MDEHDLLASKDDETVQLEQLGQTRPTNNNRSNDYSEERSPEDYEEGEQVASTDVESEEERSAIRSDFAKKRKWSEKELRRIEELNVDLASDLDTSVLSTSIPTCAFRPRKVKTFIFLMSSHTGSTAIMSQILSHPDVHFTLKNMEPLNEKKYMWNMTNALRYAREIFNEGSAKGKLTGFKINAYVVMRAPEKWAELFAEYETKVIWNYRENMFKRSVGRYPFYFMDDSTTIGGLPAQYTREQRCKSGYCQFSMEPENLRCLLQRSNFIHEEMRTALAAMTAYNNCTLQAPYDDYLYHPHESVLQIQRFLELVPYYRRPRTIKATSENMCEVVSNYAEICAHYAGCKVWGWMLEDERTNCSCSQFNYKSHGGEGVNRFCDIDTKKVADGCPIALFDRSKKKEDIATLMKKEHN